jgi:crotonobetainyl-CoA:carnitine CoA-transferase CaiB-like acyl-CoA transferase
MPESGADTRGRARDHPVACDFLASIWAGLAGPPDWLDRVGFDGAQALRSPFAVTDLAAATFAAAGLAIAELVATTGAARPTVHVDRVLASGWFDIPVAPSRPLMERPPRQHDPWLTEFPTADDRWVRVQAMFPKLRARITDTLGTKDDLAEVAAVVRRHAADEIEQLLVDSGAAVAASRTVEEWLSHPQGRAVANEPVVGIGVGPDVVEEAWRPTPGRPLAGIRVIDLTRVFAGPTATRFLAACGAEVIRIEAPGSDESEGLLGEGNDLGLGKRWAFLDLRTADGREQFLALLAEADVLVHGYRPGGIDMLGVGPKVRAQARPGLVEVALDAYGWTGPWKDRRGFDSLVQFSSGLANETTAWALLDPATRTPINAVGRLVSADRPRHLPVEALDFGTGYQMAAAAIRGLTRRVTTGRGSVSRLSLARTAAMLIEAGPGSEQPVLELPMAGPLEDRIYSSGYGPTRRLEFPLTVHGNPLFWERPFEAVGSSLPVWSTRRQGSFTPGYSVGT